MSADIAVRAAALMDLEEAYVDGKLAELAAALLVLQDALAQKADLSALQGVRVMISEIWRIVTIMQKDRHSSRSSCSSRVLRALWGPLSRQAALAGVRCCVRPAACLMESGLGAAAASPCV
jgi:hypothetical protein